MYARIAAWALSGGIIAVTTAASAQEPRPEPDRPGSAAASEASVSSQTPAAGDKLILSDAEWRRRLTPIQYWVTRQKGTEQPWTGKYSRGRHKGIFHCVGCDAPLFSSTHKFESGTGWPSFWQPVRPDALATAPDYTGPEYRVEVLCARCDAHLGHVFPDGPPPTGLRFCINSVALKLQPFPAPKPTDSRVSARPQAGPGGSGNATAAGDQVSPNRSAPADPPSARKADHEH